MTDDSTRLAVLIDADNTSSKLIKEMFEELAGYGTITVKRAYGDWTNPHLTGWRDVLLGNAISPQQQFAYTYGKNATDSALIIDAMDLLYSGNVEGFAIVSSDSDFTPLATRLRESGKRVIGVGGRKTPKAFVEACEKFVFLEVLAGDQTTTDTTDTTEPTKAEQPRPIQSVLTKALNRVDTDDDDWASLSALGNHLNRTDPAFDARNYGFGKLSELVKAQPFLETKTVVGTGGRGRLWLRLKGRRPAEEKPAVTEAAKKTVKKAAAKKATKEVAKKAAAKKVASKTAKKAPGSRSPG
ncbi:NYN domain-containing protein [Actinopolymorpha singaporensis]